LRRFISPKKVFGFISCCATASEEEQETPSRRLGFRTIVIAADCGCFVQAAFAQSRPTI
jgi:hypothetical protein